MKFEFSTNLPAAAHQYLFDVNCRNLRQAMERGESQYNLDLINHSEFFDIRLRQYISGFRKTMHQVLDEVRVFVRCYGEAGIAVIESIIERMRSDFLSNEWYELMPRFESAAVRIVLKCEATTERW